MTREAVIAVGSNSTRLLVADLDGALTDRVRGRQETGLFLALGQDLGMGAQAAQSVRAAVADLHRQARAAGAERTHLIATSAVRDAGGGETLREAIFEDTGLSLRVITGAQEARLSFLGAACAFPPGTRLGVLDIGGGSCEAALGTPEGPEYFHSAQMGAARLYRAHPVDAPGDVQGAVRLARQALDGLPPLPWLPQKWLLVGGTGAALVGLLRGALMDADAEGDEPFTRAQALRALRMLSQLSPQGRSALPDMTRGREHILPTGLCVLAVLMKRFHIREMDVTARNNTDGYLFALMRGQEI